jgi:hypothetical protein
MLRDLLTQIAWNKKWLLILDTPEPVDSENINFFQNVIFNSYKYVAEIGKKLNFSIFLKKSYSLLNLF